MRFTISTASATGLLRNGTVEHSRDIRHLVNTQGEVIHRVARVIAPASGWPTFPRESDYLFIQPGQTVDIDFWMDWRTGTERFATITV